MPWCIMFKGNKFTSVASLLLTSQVKSSCLPSSINLCANLSSNRSRKVVKAPIITLNDGTLMPAFGLGTYTGSSSVGSKSNTYATDGICERAVKDAIDAGYRHFDTAYLYKNEHEVGKAVKDKICEGVIKRDDVYIVTKLWCHFHDPERVEKACRISLKNFGLEYVDCYLMHTPYGYVYQGDDALFPKDDKGNIALSNVDYLDTWKAMENLICLGLTKSIGVSNFNSEQIERLLSVAQIKSVHNQIEVHLNINQKNFIKFCKCKDIVVTGYSPLGRPDMALKTPDFLFHKSVQAIADKYKKTPTQVALRFIVELGAVPIPKSVTKSRIQQNINIFDFELDAEDHKILECFNNGKRLFPLEHAMKSKYYPFHIEEC